MRLPTIIRKSLSSTIYLLILGLYLGSCSYPVNILGEPSSSYHRALKNNTRKKSNMTVEKVVYETTAIHWSPQLRQAYVEEFARRYRLSQEEKLALVEEQATLAQNYEEFIIFHYASDPNSSKITSQAKDWKIRLAYGNTPEEYKPYQINQLQEDQNQLTYFFPSHTPWSKNYRVRFEKKAIDQDPIILYLDHVEGNLRFTWEK